jgi:hypothetical protein
VRYILLTYSGPEHTQTWLDASPEERQAEVDEVVGWFRSQGALGRIVGGEELGWPTGARTVRVDGVTDGPFVETKEILGGFIVVEVPAEATAIEMARTWPGLRFPTDAVEVRPVGDSAAEAGEAGTAPV